MRGCFLCRVSSPLWAGFLQEERFILRGRGPLSLGQEALLVDVRDKPLNFTELELHVRSVHHGQCVHREAMYTVYTPRDHTRHIHPGIIPGIYHPGSYNPPGRL